MRYSQTCPSLPQYLDSPSFVERLDFPRHSVAGRNKRERIAERPLNQNCGGLFAPDREAPGQAPPQPPSPGDPIATAPHLLLKRTGLTAASAAAAAMSDPAALRVPAASGPPRCYGRPPLPAHASDAIPRSHRRHLWCGQEAAPVMAGKELPVLPPLPRLPN